MNTEKTSKNVAYTGLFAAVAASVISSSNVFIFIDILDFHLMIREYAPTKFLYHFYFEQNFQ